MKQHIQFLQLILLTLIVLLFCGCVNTSQLSANSSFTKVDKVALLLPLSGRYGHYGQAIRNGFFTAYYDQKKHTDYVPAISVIDTSGKNIEDLYRMAILKGANFVVGPLEKNNVQILIDHRVLTAPTLLLNIIPNSRLGDNVFAFGLSPADEADQAAKKVWQDHYQRAIIIAKNNAWSKQVVSAFAAQWRQLGGKIVEIQWFNNQRNLSADIRNALHLNLAIQDKQNIQRITGERVRYLPRNRQDFDSIFLVASLSETKQIVPLLKFYFAEHIPVYMISQVHDGMPNSYHDEDLDGIIFCDMPWVFVKPLPDSLENMRQQIKTLWPNNYASNARFYAFGIDAFNLIFKLSGRQESLHQGIPGATGTLYLTSSHQIYRQLLWAKIQNGQVTLVN